MLPEERAAEEAEALALALPPPAAPSARLVLDRLAETEQECDELADEIRQLRDEREHLYENERIRARVIQERNAERTRLGAELVSARQEIEQLRDALTKADQERDELVAEAIDAADVLFEADAWHCQRCGWMSYDQSQSHPHPLTPVLVSITHRTEGPTE